MSYEQGVVFAILAGLLVAFVWGFWRHDLVAFVGLLAAVAFGVVPVDQAFAGFGHPAVITVAAVLIISKALANSGAIDHLAARLAPATGQTTTHVLALAGMAAVLSAFMNNVGALALLLPVALQSAAGAGRSPAVVLMPLSFGSILGGLMTLIGTPPNIIVATYRQGAVGEPFAMFDFLPVGGAIAGLGVAYLALVGWRLVPKERQAKKAPGDLFEIAGYVTEAGVPKGSKAVGMGVSEIEEAVGDGEELAVIGLVRGKRRIFAAARRETIEAGDVLIVEAEPDGIDKLVASLGVELAGGQEFQTSGLRSDDIALMEVVVTPKSRMEGRSARSLRLRSRHGVNLVAVSRQGRPLHDRLMSIPFSAGDVVLLQGDVDQLPDVVAALGCLPLAGRGLQLGKRGQMGLAVGVFACAIGAAAVGWVPLLLALALATAAVVALNIVPVREAYDAVDWPVIVLLGALIPVGGALEATGGTALIAAAILKVSSGASPMVILALLIVVTMTLSDVMNNAATAVVMAPVAFGLATQSGVNPDAFLMGVAVGASCAFLTPIGHQNNMLVMGPGGYRFGDYWRMGLPLEILIVAVATPLILWVWPL
ncbi:MAG: SLC13 family permease [Alphaproteobacteria bacterium]